MPLNVVYDMDHNKICRFVKGYKYKMPLPNFNATEKPVAFYDLLDDGLKSRNYIAHNLVTKPQDRWIARPPKPQGVSIKDKDSKKKIVPFYDAAIYIKPSFEKILAASEAVKGFHLANKSIYKDFYHY